MKYMDRRVLECPAFPWNGDPGVCRACNKVLTGRQQRWCSPRCQNFYGRNHFWTWAREARLELDGYLCARCGDGPGYERPRYYGDRICERVWKLATPLEVNHVWPLAQQAEVEARWAPNGTRKLKHADSGCHHHLSLLITLCRACHRVITNQQFGLKLPSPQMLLDVAS